MHIFSAFSFSYRCVVMKNGIARGATNTYVCSNMAGRYVAVFGPGQNGYVFLCEVEVTGLPAGKTLSGKVV